MGDEIYCSKWFSLEFGNAWLHFFPLELTRPPVMFVMLPSFVQQIEFFFKSKALPTIAVVEVPNPNQIILCEIPWNLLVCTMYSCEAIEVWPGFF